MPASRTNTDATVLRRGNGEALFPLCRENVFPFYDPLIKKQNRNNPSVASEVRAVIEFQRIATH